MWVVKLGGSLWNAPVLPNWLDALAAHGTGRVAIVPGGGCFADQVRAAQKRWRFSDRIAHPMAVLAMQQYGWLLTGLRPELETASAPEDIATTLVRGKVAVWLPSIDRLDQAGIPGSWDITSDSLAAWLARELGAQHLALVKSVTLDRRPLSTAHLAEQGIVDPMFPEYVHNADFEATVYGRDDYARFAGALGGRDLSGSGIVYSG